MAKDKTRDAEICKKLNKLLSKKPSEEEVHQFLNDHPYSLACFNRSMRFSIYPDICSRFRNNLSNVFSKFPITTDRIPDFTVANVFTQPSQVPNEITFIELKKPDAKLFLANGRMSQDLNDAWTECLESIRLTSLNYDDFTRRLSMKMISDSEHDRPKFRLPTGNDWPLVTCAVVIGRRDTLTNAEVSKVQMLGASTNRTIQVYTFDAILDYLDRRTWK